MRLQLATVLLSSKVDDGLAMHPCRFSVVAANSAPASVDLLISISGGALSNTTLVLPPGGDFYELSLNFTAPATVPNATLTIVVDGTALGPSSGGVVTLNATSLLPAAIVPSAVRADVVDQVKRYNEARTGASRGYCRRYSMPASLRSSPHWDFKVRSDFLGAVLPRFTAGRTLFSLASLAPPFSPPQAIAPLCQVCILAGTS